jgi:hypothetical protein
MKNTILICAAALAAFALPVYAQTVPGCASVTVNNYQCNYVQAPLSYQAGYLYLFHVDIANTGPATISYNNHAAFPLMKIQNGTAVNLAAGDLQVGAWVGALYDPALALCRRSSQARRWDRQSIIHGRQRPLDLSLEHQRYLCHMPRPSPRLHRRGSTPLLEPTICSRSGHFRTV